MLTRLLNLVGLERRSNGSLHHPSPEMLALFGAVPTAAGVGVTPETAPQSPTALAACRAIYEPIGTLPFHLYRRGAGGTRERDSAHPAAAILSGDWCPWAGGAETKAALQYDALLHGAGYGLVIRVGGVPKEIHRLDPRTVTRDTSGPEPVFKVRERNVERTRDWRDILYLPTPGSADGRLVCLIQLAREAIALDIVMARHQGSLFANGARPGGVLKHPKTLKSPEVLAKLRAQFGQAVGGSDRTGSTLILEEGMDWTQVAFTSVDLQFLELRRFAVQEIARAFKVPGTLIGDLDRATWRNVEELMRQFVQTCLMPWAEVWQAGLERVLLTPDERREFFVEAVFDDMLRGDLAARFTAYRQACGGAWLIPNEIRALDNRPPVEGGDELIRQAGQADAAGGNPDPAQQEAPSDAT